MPAIAMSARPVDSPVRGITAEDYFNMEFDDPAELIDGEIKHMSTNNLIHTDLSAEIGMSLRIWTKASNKFKAFTGDARIQISENRVRGADLVVISNERLAKASDPTKCLDIAPEVIVEIASPGNSWEDLTLKINEYLQMGTDEVWIVSPAMDQIIVRDQSRKEMTFQRGETLTSACLPEFELSLEEVFSSVDDLRNQQPVQN